MNQKNISKLMESAESIHFVGIGGISMSSLAAITKERGYSVSGSDRAKSALTEKLALSGIETAYCHAAENVLGKSLVVYTAAVKSDNPELVEAKKLNIPLCTRADYLGWLMSGYKNRIGVAGTHGKSTVTSMLAEIYMASELDPTVVSGAVLGDMGGAYRIGGEDHFIFEACEYCDSFLSFCPTSTVITNIEYDHADYFKTMDQLRESFLKYMSMAKRAITCAEDGESVKLSEKYCGETVSFGIEKGDYTAKSISFENGCASFVLSFKNKPLTRISLSVPGRHNALNALAAAAAAISEGVSPDSVALGLMAFRGAERRFQYVGKTKNGAPVYNDYAHHPSEIKATLSAAKAFGKRIVTVFQPHTYSRTAGLWNEFTKAFTDSDLTVIADIYAAREVNSFGVTSEMLAKELENGIYLPSFEAISEFLRDECDENDLILILGAGDIVKLGEMTVSQKN